LLERCGRQHLIALVVLHHDNDERLLVTGVAGWDDLLAVAVDEADVPTWSVPDVGGAEPHAVASPNAMLAMSRVNRSHDLRSDPSCVRMSGRIPA
jgi:hypothetical protein